MAQIRIYTPQTRTRTPNIGQASLQQPISMSNTAAARTMQSIAQSAKGISTSLANTFVEEEKKKKELQTATDILAATEAYEQEALAFERDYAEQHKGADARAAGDAYTQYHSEARTKAREQFADNPKAQYAFDQYVSRSSLSSIQRGYNYADGQDALYRQDTVAARWAGLSQFAASTDDVAAIERKRIEVQRETSALLPERDLTADFAAKDAALWGNVVNTRLAKGDLQGAKSVLENKRAELGMAYDETVGRVKAEEKRVQAEFKYQQMLANVGTRDALGDAFAMMGQGESPDYIPSDSEIYAAYPEAEAEKAIAQKKSLMEVAPNLKAMMTMTPKEVNDFLKAQKPTGQSGYAEQSSKYAVYVKEAQRLETQRNDDPVAFALRSNDALMKSGEAFFSDMNKESAQSYFMALKAQKEVLGMSDGALLSKDQAAHFAKLFDESENPVALMTELSNMVGPRDFALMQEQIVKENKLSMPVTLMASGMSETAGRRLQQTNAEGFEDTFKKSKPDIDGKDIRLAVNKALKGVNGTFFAEGNYSIAGELTGQTEKLAKSYMLDGYDMGTAVERASQEIILGRYDVAGGVRIPLGQNTKVIRTGLTKAKEAVLLKMKLAKGDDSIRHEQEKQLVRNGYFVTNEDESGVVLFSGYRVYEDSEGKEIGYTWKELEDLGLVPITVSRMGMRSGVL